IYIPLVLLLLLVPYFLYDSYQQSNRVSRLIESIAHGNSDFEILSQLMRAPMKSFKGAVAEEVRTSEPLDYKNFKILHDSRIIDLRSWDPTGAGETDTALVVYGYRHLKVQKTENDGNNVFRVIALPTHPGSQFRFPPQRFPPRLRQRYVEKRNAPKKTCQ